MGWLDTITIVGALLLPVWIGGGVWMFGHLVKLPMPIYMGLATPLGLIMAAVPTGLMVRAIERHHQFDRCVIHSNAADPLNGCPDWTVRLLAGRTGA